MSNKNNDSGYEQLSMLGDFDPTPIESILPATKQSDSKYPTLLSIVPLFTPGDRENYTTDQNNGLVYPIDNGRIRRIGPGLDVYDEDTLIAILQLMEKKVVGPREAMPVALPPAMDNSEEDQTTVYKGTVTAPRINAFLGRGDGGIDNERTRDSIKRLANQRLWFESRDASDPEAMEGVTDFFKYMGKSDLRGELLIQISPQMVNLLQQYQIIDMNVRVKLNDAGKAVHRYLTAQPENFDISLDDLAEAICYEPGGSALKRALMGRKATAKTKARPNQLDLMKELGFLKSWELSGTGRGTPFRLFIQKNPITKTLTSDETLVIESS